MKNVNTTVQSKSIHWFMHWSQRLHCSSVRYASSLLACGVFVLLLACGSVQPARVLPQGNTELAVSLGGPVLPNSSPTIVVPYLTLGAIHGISESVTITGNFHALLAVFGTLGVDVGAAAQLVKQDGAIPEITAKAQAYVFSNFKNNGTRVFPYLSVNASYALGSSALVYGGFENVFQISTPPNANYFATPFLGAQFDVSERVKLQAEAKWMAANVLTKNGIFEAQSSIAGNGSIAAFVGFSFLLNGTPPQATTGK